MSKITASTDFDRVSEKEVPRYVSMFCEQVSQILSRGLNLQDNFDGTLVTVTFGNANTDATIDHGLGRIPSSYTLRGSTVAMNVFDGTVAATTSQITLQASAAGTAKLWIY